MNQRAPMILLFDTIYGPVQNGMDPVRQISKLRTLSPKEIEHIQNGAYVILKDNGALYQKFRREGVTRVWCEHPSELPVYDISGTIGNVLIGINTHTWLQWEHSKCCSLSHACDWTRFIWSGLNQGPYGQSMYTDKKPLIIQQNKIIF